MTDAKQVATRKEPDQVLTIINTLQHREMQEVLRKSLPDGASLERFTQATIAALKHRPDIFLDCDRNSVYNAIVEAAKDGLLPDGRHGALAPFRTKQGDGYIKKCQFLIMPEGIIDKLAKIGITVYAVSVYEGDTIRIWNDDTGQHVEHEPRTFGARGARMGAYACARIQKTGATFIEAMNMEDLEAPKRVTKSRDKSGALYGPWADFPERMEQKTCLHRLCKRLPNVTIADDEEFRDDVPSTVTIDAPVATLSPVKSERPAALQRVVDAAAPDKQPPETSEEPPPIEGPF
jgi:phage RecT family recombinase